MNTENTVNAYDNLLNISEILRDIDFTGYKRYYKWYRKKEVLWMWSGEGRKIQNQIKSIFV